MISLQYKGRIHKGKLTARSIRYVLSDLAARGFPHLQRRWLFPVESRPIEAAACEDVPLPSNVVSTRTPPCMTELGIAQRSPLQLTDHIYSVEDVLVTGWAGAMIKDGLLLTIRPTHNWVSSLRGHPHRLRSLSAKRPYYNLMAPIPARGHIFHWLFNSILPLVSFLESGGGGADLGLVVNGKQSDFQSLTLGFLKQKYGIKEIEPVGQYEAVRVPHLKAAIPVPHVPRALQSPAGLSVLDELGGFISGKASPDTPKRIYVSRNDAKLRRVLNEHELLPLLNARGFECVVLAGMPLASQVQLFRHAEAVFAPHGAGLAHIAWCRAGTKIVEFFPSPQGPGGKARNASFDYWLISEQRALEYQCYLGGRAQTRSDSFCIPENLLDNALENSFPTNNA